MDLFKMLNKKQRRTAFESSSQMRYFLDNQVLLSEVPYFSNLKKAQNPFDVIRANVVILSLISKMKIEKLYFSQRKEILKNGGNIQPEKLQEQVIAALSDLPKFESNGDLVILPIFSKAVNRIYINNLEELRNNPYKMLLDNFDSAAIDPFDFYGVDIYNSPFTKLQLIKRHGDSAAFYDADSLSIYFVNKQGRLDVKLSLFDKYCRHPNFANIVERIIPVIEAYYEDDKEKMIQALVDNKLISSTFLHKQNKVTNDIIKRREKKHGK